MSKIQIRRAVETDIGFITDTWKSAARKTNTFRDMPWESYHRYIHKAMEELLGRCHIRVAYMPFEEVEYNQELHLRRTPDYIVGYIVFESLERWGTVVHWSLVRRDRSGGGDVDFQRRGIGTMLLDYALEVAGDDYGVYTLMNSAVKQNAVQKKLEERCMIYNPILLFNLMPPGWEADRGHMPDG